MAGSAWTGKLAAIFFATTIVALAALGIILFLGQRPAELLLAAVETQTPEPTVGPTELLLTREALYPATPTPTYIVVTAGPTAADVFEAATRSALATQDAEVRGSPTPTPPNMVTATPVPYLLVTNTPTPGNAATAEQRARLATAQAATTGTPTPFPEWAATPTDAVEQAIVVTPQPRPRDVFEAGTRAAEATTGALRFGTPTATPPNMITATYTPQPVVLTSTPTPANQATAGVRSAYATAVAATTGTFTPVPPNAVTPMVVLPTPAPANVMTAAAQAATEEADPPGKADPPGDADPPDDPDPPTALPFNAVIATVTPGPYVLIYTPTPANQATAVANAVYATAVARTTGTFTPMPPGGQTPTPSPSPTPLPLIVYGLTARPTATATPDGPGPLPEPFPGKILFVSNREGGQRLYLLDPATGDLAWLTQGWPYARALANEALAPDGQQSVVVRMVPYGQDVKRSDGSKVRDYAYIPQLVALDARYKTERQITHDPAQSYDAAWSPKGDHIVYVSAAPGNDEIYTIDPDGGNATRLTNNAWEWDKHPSWSPDGTQIVFWSNRESGRRQLWIMDADGANQRRLLDSGYDDWDPIWVK